MRRLAYNDRWRISRGSLLKRRKVLAIIRRESSKRGKLREDKFNQAAELLKEDGSIIHHYKASYYDDRIKKTDHYIIDNLKRIIPVQIKGTYDAVRKFKEKYGDKFNVRFFILKGTESDEEVAKRIMEEIVRYK